METEESAIVISSSHVPGKSALLEEKRMNLQAGLVGKLFGSKDNAPTNIVGTAVILCLSVMAVLMFMLALGWSSKPEEIWKALGVLTPIVTGALGYMFGKN